MRFSGLKMKKRVLFVCKHNIFRSRVGEELFNNMYKGNKYFADSAGIISWKKEDLKGDQMFVAETKLAKEFGVNLRNIESKPLTSSLLKKTNTVIIVADDVPKEIFNDKAFKGNILVWKTPDVKQKDKDKKGVAEKSIKFIEKNVKNLVKKLK